MMMLPKLKGNDEQKYQPISSQRTTTTTIVEEDEGEYETGDFNNEGSCSYAPAKKQSIDSVLLSDVVKERDMLRKALSVTFVFVTVLVLFGISTFTQQPASTTTSQLIIIADDSSSTGTNIGTGVHQLSSNNEDGTPTWCEQLLEYNRTNNNVHKLIEPQLEYVAAPLIEHCHVHNGKLDLEGLLPDLQYFRRVYDAVQSYAGTDIALAAGRGTTGTRSLTHDWINRRTTGAVHYTAAFCPLFDGTAECMRNVSKPVINDIVPAYLDVIRDHTRMEDKITEPPTVEQYDNILYELMDNGIAKILQCGACGNPLVISDSPWVGLFGELYLALPTTTKVILTRRDSKEWAASRIQHHAYGPASFMCHPTENHAVHTPFSYLECAHSATRRADSIGGYTSVQVQDAYTKYNAFVRAIVPGEYLLDLNIFSSSIVGRGRDNENSGPQEWTATLQHMVHLYLEP